LLHGDPQGRHEPLLAQVPALIWVADTDLRLVWWTGGGIESLGVRPADVIGTDIYEFMGTRDAGDPAIAANQRALRGEASSYEAHYGGVFMTAHVAPRHDASGAIAGVIGVAVDITDRVEAERHLRHALERVDTLSGLIPICMHCKNVRNDSGYWEQVEIYVRQHSLAEFSHGICPECMERVLEDDRRQSG
jgi:PAS domain S-box-containing protein